MNPTRPLQQGLRIIAAAVAAMGLVVHLAASCQAAADDQIEFGRELFEHQWVPDDPLCEEGDGLGPMYNANSCAACHHLRAPGGGGSLEHNVDLLSRDIPDANSSSRKKSALRSNVEKVHPAFSAPPNGATNVLLHRFSTEPRYERWRLVLLGFKPPVALSPDNAANFSRAIQEKQSSRPPVADLPRKHGVSLRLSQRNSTALFGAGLIDSISDDTLLKLAKEQAERNDGIAGRVARASDRKVGRFGWRGQVATLRDFVLTACAMELGLQNEGHAQALDPLSPRKYQSGTDLTPEQCNALVAYVASLPAPVELPAVDQQQAKMLSRGERLFESTGCAACHVRDVGNVHGLYSDLLLHDMGPSLEDPLPAIPERIRAQSEGNSVYASGSVQSIAGASSTIGRRGCGYPSASDRSDNFVDAPSNIRREWKTPALWGVRDSAPYLHDGRARTLTEAITAHGGEAELSMKKFKGLDYLSRSHLLMFVNSLGAPDEQLIASDTP